MTAQPIPLTQSGEDQFQTEQVLTIVGGHFVHDIYSAFVPPLLPLIIEKLPLTLASAGALATLTQIPALLNPFIGYLADKVSLRYFVILAPAITGTLISLLGFAPNTATLAVLLLTTGISVASFHAPAPAMIAQISGRQVGKGMSLFMAGGELGRTVGPLLAVWAVTTWGLDGFYRVMVLSWTASLLLYWRLRNIPARPGKPLDLRAMLPSLRRLFVPLLAVVFPRTFLLTALAIYLPTFMKQQGASLWIAGASLSVWEIAGVAGALLGGTLSDRLGRKTILLAGISSSSILMLVFLKAGGWLLVPILLALGFTALSTAPVMLALVQDQMPDNRAMANGLFLSMTFLTRPITAFIIGLVGDKLGLTSAYFWSAIIALIAIPGVFFLPEHKT